MKTILVGGCFDILHIGHIRFLQAAKALGDKLIVAIEGDNFIQTYKKRKPFHTQQERAEILQALTSVDTVLLLPDMGRDKDYAELVKKIQPNIIAVSQNDPQLENKRKHADLVGAEVVIVQPLIKGKSTSEILRFELQGGDQQ